MPAKIKEQNQQDDEPSHGGGLLNSEFIDRRVIR